MAEAETKKPCKRGNIAERSASGHCQCDDCKKFRYRNSSTPEIKAYQADWRKKNSAKCYSYTKKWNDANPDRRREIVNSWRSRNPENVKAMNAKGGKKWSSSNPGKRLASVRARQIAKRQRTPAWADLEKIAEIYIECAKITEESGVRHEVDHIYPLQGEKVSGLHVHQNLQIMTRSENRSKGIKV